MRALAWLGRQGAAALAVMVVVGILAPPLGALLRPYVREAVFVLLALAFLRTDVAALGALARRPWLPLAAVVWTMLATPAIALAGLALVAAPPDLALALLLQCLSMPMMAAPAIAALIGLDATLVLAGLIGASVLMPTSTPLILAWTGAPFDLPAATLAIMLAGMLAGSAALGFGLRAVVGRKRILRHGEALDGLNVIALFVFVASVMGDVGPNLLAAPGQTLWLAALGFAMNLALLIASWAVFRLAAGRRDALAVGVMASQRNLGLMLAVGGAALPETVWLYFALSQIPIYLAPLILKPIARRIR